VGGGGRRDIRLPQRDWRGMRKREMEENDRRGVVEVVEELRMVEVVLSGGEMIESSGTW